MLSKPETEGTPKEFAVYLERICGQIRWKKAHPSIRRELSGHMEDQMAEYISVGIPPEEAARKTVQEMGDPVEVGTRLDHSYRPKVDKGLLLAAGLLLLAGWFLQSVFSMPRITLLAATVLGISAMLAAMKVDYTIFAMSRRTGMTAYFLYNAVIFIFPVFYRYDHQSSYYLIFSVAVHLFLLFPLVLCGVMYSFRNQGFSGFLLCGAMAAFSLFLMLMVRGSATLVVLISSLAVMVMALKMEWFGPFSKGKRAAAYVCMFVPLGVFFLVLLANGKVHRLLSIILNPSIDDRNRGYIYIVFRSVLKSSQWIGPIDSVATPWGNFPLEELLRWNPDWILIWTVARLGWWTLCVIVPLALLICLKGFHICQRQSGELGKMISCAVVVTLAAQFLCFLQANLGIVYMIPYPFPFLQGNRSIIVNLLLLGFLLSVGQRKGLDEPAPDKNSSDFLYVKQPLAFSVRRSGQEIDVSLKLRLPEGKRHGPKEKDIPLKPD